VTLEEIREAGRLVAERTREAPITDPAILDRVAVLIVGDNSPTAKSA
jgi:hypothetical protein